jgi:hypothetical protein
MVLYTDSDIEESSTLPSGTRTPAGETFHISSDGRSIGGSIDDLRVYNRVLSKSEVNQLYQMREQRTQSNDLSKGLVGHWTMDNVDTDGNTLRDSSAYDNNGTLNGSITTGTSGQVNEAYTFDNNNTDQYVDIDNAVANEIDGTEEASLSMWVRTLTNNATAQEEDTNSGLCSFQGSGSTNTHYPWSDGKLYLPTFRSNRVGEIDDGSFDKTNWHLLTVTTTPGTDGWKLYQNTNLVTSVDGESTVKLDEDVLIGWNNHIHYFSGDIGEVRLYNRVLSASEINRLYNKRQ